MVADGILEGPAWPLDSVTTAPWNELSGSLQFLAQGTAIVRADLTTIKQVENNYRTHWNRHDHSYLELVPVRGQYFRGNVSENSPYTLQQLFTRVDLPFPFSQYQFVLSILNRVDSTGASRL